MEQTAAHDKQNHRFSVIIDNIESYADYEFRQTDQSVIDIYHTFVDPALRGKGIAGMLIKSAIEYAKQNSLKIFPSCSYAVEYFRRHPEYSDVLSEDADPENGGSCRLK